jgi:hypothetical protein
VNSDPLSVISGVVVLVFVLAICCPPTLHVRRSLQGEGRASVGNRDVAARNRAPAQLPSPVTPAVAKAMADKQGHGDRGTRESGTDPAVAFSVRSVPSSESGERVVKKEI